MKWQFATPEEYLPVCELFQSSGLSHGNIDIRRRITIPMFLQQLITFYEDSKLCGFVTFAFLNEDAETHMTAAGIYPADWRSGKTFWVIDFAVQKGFNGYKMLRIATKGLGIKKARYFRHKHQKVKEVHQI